jgi:G3E family GTPase
VSKPLPVTVIGGYLGAGKTSLVNHLLRHADGARLAVLVNEFGALAIDEDLIVAQDGDIISIAGGCVCCSYGSDMVAALVALRQMEPTPDHILLEASGVALPSVIAGTVGLMQGFVTDGVVILADAETLRKNAEHKYMGDTVTRQLASADIVILNKVDLVAAEDLSQTKTFALGHASGAQILFAEHGKLPPEVILQSFVGRARDGGARHDVGAFSSIALPMALACNPTEVAKLLAQDDLQLVRAKGFVRDLSGNIVSVQTVGRRWAIGDANGSEALGLVCIGLKPAFDAQRVKAEIFKCCENPLAIV